MSKEISPSDRRRIAEKARISKEYLWQCLTGRRDMNPIAAIRVEAECGGEITRFDLCQKTGVGIWPELAQALAHPSQTAIETEAIEVPNA